MGTPVPQPAGQKSNVLSIISLVTGILGLVSMCLSIIPILGWFCIAAGSLLSIAALVTGFIGMNKIKQTGEKGRGMAITGIVLGALGVLGICVVVILNIAAPSILNQFLNNVNLNQYLTPAP